MKKNITGTASISINAPASQVWEALTTPSIIEKYFFGTYVITDWKPGSPIIFKGDWEGRHYEDKGILLHVIPEKLLKYTFWSSLSGVENTPENYITVTYDLSEKDNFTTVMVTEENIPDEKQRERAASNWSKVLDGLKKLLESSSEYAKAGTHQIF